MNVLSTTGEIVPASISARSSSGSRAFSLEMNVPNGNPPGCDYHPNLETHQAMADVIVAELEGVELEYRFDRGGWTAGGNLAWQDAVDARTDAPLLRRAKRKAHADLGYRFRNSLRIGVAAFWADRTSSFADLGIEGLLVGLTVTYQPGVR